MAALGVDELAVNDAEEIMSTVYAGTGKDATCLCKVLQALVTPCVRASLAIFEGRLCHNLGSWPPTETWKFLPSTSKAQKLVFQEIQSREDGVEGLSPGESAVEKAFEECHSMISVATPVGKKGKPAKGAKEAMDLLQTQSAQIEMSLSLDKARNAVFHAINFSRENPVTLETDKKDGIAREVIDKSLITYAMDAKNALNSLQESYQSFEEAEVRFKDKDNFDKVITESRETWAIEMSSLYKGLPKLLKTAIQNLNRSCPSCQEVMTEKPTPEAKEAAEEAILENERHEMIPAQMKAVRKLRWEGERLLQSYGQSYAGPLIDEAEEAHFRARQTLACSSILKYILITAPSDEKKRNKVAAKRECYNTIENLQKHAMKGANDDDTTKKANRSIQPSAAWMNELAKS